MAFHTPTFLFLFLPAVLALHALLPLRRRNGFLLGVSLLAYAWASPGGALLLLALIFFCRLVSRRLEASAEPGRRRWLSLGVVGSLAPLFLFKYGAFLADSWNNSAASFGLPLLPVPALTAPAGISFYTFMAIAFLLEVSRRPAGPSGPTPQPGLYLSFFAHVGAGPITRWKEFAPQLADRQLAGEAGLDAGARRFVFGLAKKLLLAVPLAALSDRLFALPLFHLDAGLAWLAVVTFALQIYTDFSAYSDMAIGLGAMFGFRLAENFAYPYAARTLGEFWRRWHITLSTWLRDFLFLPIAYALSRRIRRPRLAGVPAESLAYVGAVLATMLLAGLWHGAGWNFVLWGGWLGSWMAVEHLLRRPLRRLPALPGHAVTLLVLLVGWAWFRAPDPFAASSLTRALFGQGSGGGVVHYPGLYLDARTWLALAAGALAATPLPARAGRWLCRRLGGAGFLLAELYPAALLVASLMALAGTTHAPFLYSRF